MASKAKPEYVMLSYYSSLYKSKYGTAPMINKYREKWGMLDAIDSMGEVNVKRCLDYFFTTSVSGHPLSFFYSNYDRIFATIEMKESDARLRARLLDETRRRVEGE